MFKLNASVIKWCLKHSVEWKKVFPILNWYQMNSLSIYAGTH